MESAYSLEYFDRIFGQRGPEFWELLTALEEQLESYANDLRPVVAARDSSALARLRHTHRPLVENLGLSRLQALEGEIREAVESGAPDERLRSLAERFEGYARALARDLSGERKGPPV